MIQKKKFEFSEKESKLVEQNKKLKNLFDQKERKMTVMINKLKRSYSEAEQQILKLKEEKYRLKNKLIDLEKDKQRDLDTVRAKNEANFQE